MKLFLYTSICFFIISCKTETKKYNVFKEQEKTEIIKTKTLKTEIGKVFFDFDEIDFYNTDFDEKKSIVLIQNKENSELDKLKYEIILEETPKNIQDLEFLNKMTEIGFTHKKIESDKFKSINEIFVEKNISNDYAYGCAPVYRDILIFKKNEKIIGVAKICFGCEQNIIIGTKANTVNFGHNGDYGRLKNILNN